ncbi:MAG: tyrosine-type recombinase/integrase, partial [Caulobacterales bacterium]
MPKFSPSADRLTKTAIGQLSTAASRYRVRDLGCEGLYLVVEPTGRKHWIVRYPGERGVQREKGLGAYPAVLPEQARVQALAVRGAVAREGADPIKQERAARRQARETEATAPDQTFTALSDLYFAASEAGWHGHKPKAASTLLKERQNWAKHLAPVFGPRPFAEITRRDVIARVEEIGRASGPGAANTALEVIRQIFTYAEFKALIDIHPAVRIPKFTTEPRDVVASEIQLRKLWLELDRIRHG